jgi:hypothetical protein
MSLAHLRVVKSRRTRSAAGAASGGRAVPTSSSYCGASSEPVYRTMDEAAASGLQLCDSCLADFRRQRKVD